MRCGETARSKRIQNGRMGVKRFEGEGGVEVLHWQRANRFEQWSYTNWRSPMRKSQCNQKKQGGNSKSESCQEF